MKTRLLLLVALFFLALVPHVYADDEGNFDLNAVPIQLATRLNISLFAAQILMSVILMGIFLFTSAILTKNVLAHVFAGVGPLGFCIALGWFPVWVFVIICLIVTFLYVKLMTSLFGGKS